VLIGSGTQPPNEEGFPANINILLYTIIIMGKYDYNETQDNPLKFECYIKTAIANELAELVDAQKVTANNTNDMARQLKEANRLKRLEINYLYAQDGDTPIPELEDKA